MYRRSANIVQPSFDLTYVLAENWQRLRLQIKLRLQNQSILPVIPRLHDI